MEVLQVGRDVLSRDESVVGFRRDHPLCESLHGRSCLNVKVAQPFARALSGEQTIRVNVDVCAHQCQVTCEGRRPPVPQTLSQHCGDRHPLFEIVPFYLWER
jgi:hypothetical protein